MVDASPDSAAVTMTSPTRQPPNQNGLNTTIDLPNSPTLTATATATMDSAPATRPNSPTQNVRVETMPSDSTPTVTDSPASNTTKLLNNPQHWRRNTLFNENAQHLLYGDMDFKYWRRVFMGNAPLPERTPWVPVPFTTHVRTFNDGRAFHERLVPNKRE